MTKSNRNILLIASAVLVGAILYYFCDIVTYVILAWVLSMIGQPVMDFFKKFMNRNLAALITLFGFMIVFTGLVWIFVPTIVQQTKNLAE